MASQTSGQVVVVGIKPADQVSGSAQKAFVDGIGLAPVGLRDAAHSGVALHHGQRVVGGGAVDDDVLDRHVLLARHTQDRVFNELFTVERWSDDGESWAVHRLRPQG